MFVNPCIFRNCNFAAFELIVMWEEKTVESSMEMAELENVSIHEAHKWFIVPEFSSYL